MRDAQRGMWMVPVIAGRRRGDDVVEEFLSVAALRGMQSLPREITEKPEPVLRFLACVVIRTPTLDLVHGFEVHGLRELHQLGSVHQLVKLLRFGKEGFERLNRDEGPDAVALCLLRHLDRAGVVAILAAKVMVLAAGNDLCSTPAALPTGLLSLGNRNGRELLS
jgi:hypothetical protein